MSKKYDNKGNITEAHKLATTGNKNSDEESLREQVFKIAAASRKLNLVDLLATTSNVTPDRINRISKGKIPNNENVLAKIVVAWDELKSQGKVPNEPPHEPTALEEIFGLAHT